MRASYPTYKPTSIPWLPAMPEHWEQVPLFSLIQVKSIKNRAQYPLLSVYRDYGVILKSSRDDNHNKPGEDLSNYKFVGVGDLVLNKMKTWQGSLGISKYDGIVSPAYIVCKVSKKVNGDFLHHLLRSHDYIYEYNRLSYGIRVDQWDMHFEDFKRVPVFLPPFTEQTAISNYLDAKTEQINRFIEKKQKLIALLKEQKQAVINELLEDKEGKWERRKLRHVIKGKLKYGANESGIPFNPEYPRYIRITDFGSDGKLRNDDMLSLHPNVAKDYILKDGDILFARSGGTVGKTFQYRKNNEDANLSCYAGYLIKAEPNEKIILSDFLYAYTLSGYYEQWKEGIFNKATIENIGADKYSQLSIPVPSIEIQKEILKNIYLETSKIEEAIFRIEREIEKVKELKQSLIAEVVTGRIKVV